MATWGWGCWAVATAVEGAIGWITAYLRSTPGGAVVAVG